MELLKTIVDFIPTDQALGDFLQTIKADYLIFAVIAWKLAGKPVIWLFKWLAAKTPWTSDDELWGDVERKIDEALNKKLGMPPSR